MHITTDRNYRQILKEELEKRMNLNSRYSLRSFARDLEIRPSRLSEILNNRYGLSRKAAEKIAEKLGYTGKEKEIFCDLVESIHARSKIKKNLAKIRLDKYRKSSEISDLQLDHFKIISFFCFLK